MTDEEEGFTEAGNPRHEHPVQKAMGVLGEPAWYCTVCEAWTFNSKVVRPKGAPA